MSLKKKVALGSSLALLVVLFCTYMVLTVPVIDKQSRDGVAYVGGETSHASVAYTDYRPATHDHAAAKVWWGTSDGEWRRLEYYNGFYHSWGTEAVLRDVAYRGSTFGIQRGSKGNEELQHNYDEVRRAYERQSFFDRVWLWQVGEFH